MNLFVLNEDLVAAYRSAWRKRHCPPEKLLARSDDPRISAHLKICEECEALAAALREQPDLHAGFALLVGSAGALGLPQVPQPGEIWSLSEDMEGWLDEARYANAPMVLVLELPSDLPGVAQVVQIGEDPEFCGPGDVLLPMGDTYAQAWNVYTLDAEAFSHRLGNLPAQVLEHVQSEVARLDQEGVDEGLLEPVLKSYRRMETLVGWRFHSLCLPSLIAHAEAQAEEGEKAAPDQVRWWEGLKESAFGAAARLFHVPGQLASIPSYTTSSAKDILLAFLEPQQALSAAGACIVANRQRPDGEIIQEQLTLEHRQDDERGVTLVFSFPCRQAQTQHAAAFRFLADMETPQVAAECQLEQEGDRMLLTVVFSAFDPDFNFEKHLRIGLRDALHYEGSGGY